MKIICSWCGKVIGEKDPLTDKSESHTRCPDCLKKQSRESNKQVRNREASTA